MKVRIMYNHPIATQAAPQCWDDKVHTFDGDLLDVRELGAWLTKKVGVKFCYLPGYSRVIDGRACFFPRRYVSGLHCMWVEEE